MAYIELNVDLYEFKTEDLVAELRFRKWGNLKDLDVPWTDVTTLLRGLGVPQMILEKLEWWQNERIVTERDLERWVALCK